MDSVLIDEWLGSAEATPAPRRAVIDGASVAVVRELVRSEGKKLGLPDSTIGSLVNVASELGHNQLAHARRGEFVIRSIERAGTPGLEIVAADAGDGIMDPREALRGAPRVPSVRFPSPQSLGVGLAAVMELADEIDFDIRIGEGTCVWARKFAQPVPRRRQVGLYGRPFHEELISGDHGAFVRSEGALLVGVADGLGHGPAARDASNPAVATLRDESQMPVDRVLAACHGALAATRGAVMAVARIEEPGEEVDAACVGNVSLHIYGLGASRRISGPSFVLGAPGPVRKPTREVRPFSSSDVLVLFTDGLSTRTDLEGDLDLLREHPIVIAHALVQRFGRDNDDVLVLVAR